MNDEKSNRIFLCHNSKDKTEVRQVYFALRTLGYTPWMDEFDISPGDRWRPEIEEAIQSCGTVAVFLGKAGGRIMEREIDQCVALESRGQLKVIPVILPAFEEDKVVGGFLSSYSWVDFRSPIPDPLTRLGEGIGEVSRLKIPTISVAPSASSNRSRLVVYTQNAGFLVPRAGLYPVNSAKALEAFSTDLDECDVVVSFCSAGTGSVAEATDGPIMKALDSFRHANRILRWNPERSTFAEFQKQVIDRAQRAFDATRPNSGMDVEGDSQSTDDAGQKWAMVNYHDDDKVSTLEMLQVLMKNNVTCTSSSNGKTSLAERMRENPFDALVVVLGNCAKDWLESRVDELIGVNLTLKEQVPLQVYYHADGSTVVPPHNLPSTLHIFGKAELDKLCRAIRGELQ